MFGDFLGFLLKTCPLRTPVVTDANESNSFSEDRVYLVPCVVKLFLRTRLLGVPLWSMFEVRLEKVWKFIVPHWCFFG